MTPEEIAAKKAEEEKKQNDKINLQNLNAAQAEEAAKLKKAAEAIDAMPEGKEKESKLEKLDKRIEEYNQAWDPIWKAVQEKLDNGGGGLMQAWAAMCKAMMAYENAGGKPLISLHILDPRVLLNPVKLLNALNPFSSKGGLLTGGVLDLKGWSSQQYEHMKNSHNKGLKGRIQFLNQTKDLMNTIGSTVGLWEKQAKIDPLQKKALKENIAASDQKRAQDMFKPKDSSAQPEPVNNTANRNNP